MKGIQGFQKGNKEWDNPNVKTAQFKKGMRPWNYGKSGNHNPQSHYVSIHQWMKRHYGSANLCDNNDCNGNSKTYEWALIKGKKYEMKRESFMQLCKKCHVAYDNWSKNLWIARRKNGTATKIHPYYYDLVKSLYFMEKITQLSIAKLFSVDQATISHITSRHSESFCQ